ncbi:MAG: hypothetical protein WBD20_26595 [Pirellulaceae bacterium]
MRIIDEASLGPLLARRFARPVLSDFDLDFAVGTGVFRECLELGVGFIGLDE